MLVYYVVGGEVNVEFSSTIWKTYSRSNIAKPQVCIPTKTTAIHSRFSITPVVAYTQKR